MLDSNLLSRAQVVVWGIFPWHTLYPVVPTKRHSNTTRYLSVVADHFLPFMTTLHSFTVTFPSPGVSLILFAARRRQGGAGGGAINRVELKLVGNRGGSHDGDDVTVAVSAAVFCFFFLDAKLNFWAALRERKAENKRKKEKERQQSTCHIIMLKLHCDKVKTNSKYCQEMDGERRGGMGARMHAHTVWLCTHPDPK